MKQIPRIVLFRVGFAILSLAAVITQLVYGMARNNLDPVNFLSYFTIESNIFALSVFLVAAWFSYQKRSDRGLDYLRGAATLYMLITGLIYVILLSNVDVNTPLPWVNTVLHYIFPIAVLTDWLLHKPSRNIQAKQALLWLTFPLAYFVYSLIRGHITGWYPYPFLDAGSIGYAQVAFNAATIALGTAFLALIVARAGVGQPSRR